MTRWKLKQKALADLAPRCDRCDYARERVASGLVHKVEVSLSQLQMTSSKYTQLEEFAPSQLVVKCHVCHTDPKLNQQSRHLEFF